MKLSASTPRVTRSPVPERGQAIVMDGDLFEDGRQRIVVGYDVLPEYADDLGRRMDERDAAQERLDRLLAAVNALMGDGESHDCGSAPYEPAGVSDRSSGPILNARMV